MHRRERRLVVVGGGFSGSSLLRSLPHTLKTPGETLLVDRAADYPFIPLIHEVAVGRIHPESIRFPIANICKNGCEFLRAEVTALDLAGRTLQTSSGEIGYEYLVLGVGSGAARPPETLAGHFHLFRTLEDALRLRRALNDFWWGAVAPGETSKPGALTVAIVGGGTTGVELAAEIAVLFDYLIKRTPRRPSAEPRVLLFEATGRLMGWLDPYFHRIAMEKLADLGVEVHLNTPIEEATGEGIRTGGEWRPARLRIWTTGIETPPIVRSIPGDHDPAGRVAVSKHLTLPGHPEVYVLGDSGAYEDPRYGLLPPTGSVAVQQGFWAGSDLERKISGRRRPPFDFSNRGYVVSLGPESAVAEAMSIKLKGPAAQALYRSVLLYYLKNTRDRILTGADWTMERTLGRVGFGGGVNRKSSPG